jgi:ribosome maturation factor RimP
LEPHDGVFLYLEVFLAQVSLEEVVEKSVVAAGYEFYSMSLTRHSGVDILRVFIDNSDIIKLEDCVKADKQIKLNMVTYDYDPGKYNIEVSSPGLTRDLSKKDHFLKVIGKSIKVKYRSDMINNTLTGKLLSFDGTNLLVQGEDFSEVVINLDNVIKSSLCLEVK